MTTLIRARGPRELLAYVPYRLGYRPRDSVVLVGLRGPRGRVGLVVRVDVEDLADVERGPQVARTVLAHLAADGAGRVVLVAYTDAPLRAAVPTAARERAAVEHCREAVESLLGPTDVWVVSSTGWSGLDCTDLTCCPADGRPLRELEGSEVGAHMVLAGESVADSREEALRIPRATADARRRAARAARRARARPGAPQLGTLSGVPSGAPSAGTTVAWRLEGLRAWRSATALLADGEGGVPATLPATLVGRLEAALESVPVRDAVLLSLVPGGDDDLAERTVRGVDAEAGTGAAIARLVDPAVAVVPDPSLTGPARVVLEAVVAHAARGRAAPALTLLALVAWWHGDGGRAAERLREALAEDPAYRLALLLLSAVDAGVPPGWVRARE
ncbi:DUF4192 domain-containing protein [Cellulosimicrobium sp. CUA-896]|uniref:DUF4192 domain-containing protein n=1 Tax=Cellulosimicrobium sp. CUA-896 TaxID=1517881 RepID=UPI0009696197|nr:DUF4192 domain-containing protein [Cellulosimicrobium sp. CUA-896]OLT51344.1 hypothetical protein BJF88_15125 [Cellulosimicrobium sp. CUA-896]